MKILSFIFALWAVLMTSVLACVISFPFFYFQAVYMITLPWAYLLGIQLGKGKLIFLSNFAVPE